MYELQIIFCTLKFRTDQILRNTRNLAQVTTVNQAGFAQCNTNVIRERHEISSPHSWMLASKTRTTPKQMFQEKSILVHASPSVVVRAVGLSRSYHTHSVSKAAHDLTHCCPWLELIRTCSKYMY